ncbi:uncharacterized protein LOC110245702 [Exaiptasia diaphana]|uniref:Uncharacterized protein n=1 Tax=Exaiptasia diaphana TaxID=2652724 RepID=A0A913XPL6_EXADI|nr:uncharacterized protein LOC110245702 [Exaiptasia diaphana]
MGCCLSGDQETDRNGSRGEDHPLLHAPQKEFRHERSEEDFNKHKKMKNILQCLCRSLCLYNPSGWGLIFSFILALICIFQLVYDLFVVSGCPGFDCGFLVKTIEAKPNASAPHRSSFRKTSNTVYTLASVGGLFSYTLLLLSLMLILNRRRKYANKAIGPSDALYEDLTNTQIKIIFTSQVILTFLFVSAVVLFGILVRDQPRDGWYFYLMITGVAAQFIAQWAAIVGCHVFAISSLSLGKLFLLSSQKYALSELEN